MALTHPVVYSHLVKDGDTSANARTAQIDALRRLGPAERLRLAIEMSEDARLISVEGERRRHPGATEAEARRIVARRVWGDALAGRVTDSLRNR